MILPVILKPGTFSSTDLQSLREQKGSVTVVDIYEKQLQELYEIQFPSDKELKGLDAFINEKGTGDVNGAWVYYPWLNKLLHCVGSEDLFALRTNRNKLIIDESEQQKLANVVVGIAGMSVGAGIASALAHSGISRRMKLSDFDRLSTSNLNRLKESIVNVGKPKIELAAQHIYELDPFAELELLSEGLTDENLESFFSRPNIDIVIDEIDDFKMKVRLREEAKSRGVPLIMFTSLGDNILVDVERYDLDNEQQIFNGLLGDVAKEISDKQEISPEDEKRYAVELVGADYVPTRAITSVGQIGSSLVGRPQLYSTIAIDGGLASYVVRQVVLHNRPHSGRFFIKIADLLSIESSDLEDTLERRDALKKVKK